MKDTLDITNHRKCFWLKCRILGAVETSFGPYVTTLDTGNVTITDDSHFVVTNVQQLTPNTDKWLKRFSHDYFDLIIVDEAHHNIADSWQKVLGHFPEAKVLHLTATPFRSDAREIHGDIIYRYPFRSAVNKGYIKRLKTVYITPEEIELTFKDEKHRRTLSLQELLKLKEEEWFSRGIAMSDECNKSIVDNSIGKLEQLRLDSSIKHQLIAVAMSISHANKIQLLYQERNYEAAIIHSRMKIEERQDVIRRLKNNELDVIVNVLILGEGFDHPQLSVAAIFRPYRTLSPYLQFIGRIMRVNFQNFPRHPDNYGFIVTHIGMNIDTLVQDFQLFEKDDQEFWGEIHAGLDPEPSLDRPGTSRRAIFPPISVHNETISELFEEDLIDDADESMYELKKTLEAYGYDSVSAEKLLRAARPQNSTTSQPFNLNVQPQQELERLRKQLVIETRSQAKKILSNAKFSVVGREIPNRIYKVAAVNNLIAVIVVLNQRINGKIDIDNRDAWAREDYKKALVALPELSAQLIRQLIKAKRGGYGNKK